MKLTNAIFSLSVGIFCLMTMSDSVAEKMAMPTMLSAPESLNYFKKIQKKRKLTENEMNVYKLVQVASSVFKIEEFAVEGYYQEKDKEQHLSSSSVSKAIQRSLKKKKNWDEPITKSELTKIKSIEENLKESLGSDSYTAAWLAYKNNNKLEAKKILNRGFDQAFENSLKMEHIGFSDDGNPIQDAEFYSQALTPLSNETENKIREEKLKKAQVRASNLPQILT